MEKEGGWDVSFKRVIVKMADGSIFEGDVNIRGFRRLSDYLRVTEDRFVVIRSDEGKQPRAVMVNKNFILWAEEGD